MPAEGIHLTSLREACAGPAVSPAARRCATRWEDAARMGAVMLDLPYFDRYAEEVARYVIRASPRPSAWGAEVHERAAVAMLGAALDRARSERSDRLAAVALGLASHASIDRQLHPLVNALARAHPGGRDHDAAHREVEKFHSICFHEAYFGRDRMGTAGIVRLVQVPFGELLGDATIARALEACFGVLERPPTFAALARMARGYEQHAWLIGSPVGRRIAPEADKERARPLFLEGRWGTFAGVLQAAIDRSTAVLDLAWAVYEAAEADAPAARAALEAALPLGTIDPLREELSLQAPYAP
jgi:hypothetical protein